MTIQNHPPVEPDIGKLKAHALDLRRKMMGMAFRQG